MMEMDSNTVQESIDNDVGASGGIDRRLLLSRMYLTVAVLGQYCLVVAIYREADRVLGPKSNLVKMAVPFGLLYLLLWFPACRKAGNRVVCWLALGTGFMFLPMLIAELNGYIRNYYGTRCGNSIIDPLLISSFWLIAHFVVQQLYLTSLKKFVFGSSLPDDTDNEKIPSH